jgi:hypothetical protein
MTGTGEKEPISEQKPALEQEQSIIETEESEPDMEWVDWGDEAKPSIHVEEHPEKE